MIWQKILWVALAGGAGASARFALHTVVQSWAHARGSHFPWGTLVVNAVGCLVFGFIFAWADAKTHLGPHTKLILLTGFLGAFTTFSTFGFETGHLFRSGHITHAVLNILAQNIVGILLALAGFELGKLLFPAAAA